MTHYLTRNDVLKEGEKAMKYMKREKKPADKQKQGDLFGEEI